MAHRTQPVSDPTHVFINCPFDPAYQSLFDALVFAVYACGFKARCAKEERDSGTVRIEKILRIIRECRWGIHDLSRVQMSEPYGLPRFNMPLELGFFIGCKHFGDRNDRLKNYLILDEKDFDYQKSTSDISGQDIVYHHNDPAKAIGHVRDWLSDKTHLAFIPSGSIIVSRYAQFEQGLPALCADYQQVRAELTFLDYTFLVSLWLSANQ